MPFNVLRIVVRIALLMAISQFVLGAVDIEDNGYVGLKVAIDPRVEENPVLLTNLKEIFRMASTFLYDMLKQRAYFKEVTITVPSTWSSKPEYTTDRSEGCQKCGEIRIAPPRPSTGNIPYTYQPGGCGERGKYIHLTPDFILQSLTNKPQIPTNKACVQCKKKAQILLHEWTHLRYGIFNEDGNFYKSKNQNILVTGCAQNLYGHSLNEKNIKEKCPIDKYGNTVDCIFFPDMTSGINNGSKVSIMYLPEMDSEFIEFCGDEEDSEAGLKHNSEAPNMQNKMCNGKSVSKIIFENEDFLERNPSRTISNLQPNINIIHKITNETTFATPYVLVLDTSTSMKGRPIQYLTMAVERFIKHIARKQCPIGMVSFAFDSEILAPLTAITDESREELIKKIPSKLGPATAIGKGILKAIEMLSLPGGEKQKGNIVLITDGEENANPLIDTIKAEIKESGVTIYSIAFGQNASKKLEELTTLTGGKGWQFKLDGVSKSLDSTLTEIGLTCSGKEEDLKPFINKNGAFHLEGDKNIEGSFIVDTTHATSTEVTVLFTYDFSNEIDGKVPNIFLTSPSGKEYWPSDQECTLDTHSRVLRCRLENAEAGRWTFSIENGPDPVDINLMVTSDIIYEPGSEPFDVRPVHVDSWISTENVDYPNTAKIFAKVEKNSEPVLNANVVSTLYRPNGDSVPIQLMDNGQDPDVNADDGTYTAYITKFDGDGRYAIDTIVINDGDARILKNTVDGSKAPILPNLPPHETLGKAKLIFQASDFEEVDYIIDITKKINYDELQPTEAFERFVTGGTFMLNKWEKGKDLIPPSQVRDLTAKVIDPMVKTVQLQWLSPGNDMNDGQATSVDIRYHEDPTFLIRSFEQAFDNYTVTEGSLQPPQPHEKHSLTLQLPKEVDLGRIRFAIRVSDEAQNAGNTSNLAFIEFVEFLPFTGTGNAKEQDWTIAIVGSLLATAIICPH